MTEMQGPPWVAGTLPRGVWIQLYLGSMRVVDLQRMLAEAKRLKCGVVFHGGNATHAAQARAMGVPFAFSFGLDGSGSGQAKGERLGKLLSSVSDTAFALLDAEGQWDSDKGAEDLTDEANALDLVKALRGHVGPHFVIGDQPWFAMDSHGEERRIAKPLGEGGTFGGFPSDEFASGVQFRAPQLYFRNSRDPRAYEKWRAWHERDWAKHDASLSRLGLDRPRCWTLQGYGNTERPQDIVDALLRGRDRLTVIWWDQQYAGSWAATAACIEAVNRMTALGMTPPDRSAVDCVRAWQRSLGVTDDGICGPNTLRAGV